MTKKTVQPIPEPFPSPPSHFSERAVQLWREVGPHAAKTPERQALFQSALEALDTADEARRLVRADGLIVTTARSGVRHVNPAVKVEKEARTQFIKFWKELGLSKVPPQPSVLGFNL
jgi:P27 family predicted phage terminase small subunit